jgi:hypothetical protein
MYRTAIRCGVSGKPVDLLKNYLGALSRSVLLPWKIPRPAVSIFRESRAGSLTVATLVAQELNTVCPGEPPRPVVHLILEERESKAQRHPVQNGSG